MRIIRDFHHCPTSCQDAVLALGNFDGVHRGHQAILAQAITLARTENRPAAVMTFEPHPREFFMVKPTPLHITSLRQKLELLKAQDIDITFIARFNQTLAATSAHAFIEDILVGQLHAHHVITGDNFAFGKGRQGNAALLAEFGKKLGFGYTAMPHVQDESGAIISSTSIREALTRGDMPLASHMLGRPYQIEGRVRQGKRLGRDLGFPTANLALGDRFRPRFGVYAARASIDGQEWHDAAVNIGINPTISESEPLLEAYIFHFSRDIYGQYLRVQLLEFIRDEQKFDHLDALRRQIAADCQTIQTLLGQRKAS